MSNNQKLRILDVPPCSPGPTLSNRKAEVLFSKFFRKASNNACCPYKWVVCNNYCVYVSTRRRLASLYIFTTGRCNAEQVQTDFSDMIVRFDFV